MESKGKDRKQVLLRLSPSLWEELVAWSEDEFRSINGQIEYLLTECVKQRKKGFMKKEKEIRE
ncbi:Arc family DNA-binding protein [Clostridium bovifaecis]|uniref:Arc family DNA-binding protein n=1 Tax=Clostridium bovifaecis TaxID=2184719 RepID=A0A6I6F283_9CLOT|nr:Arc family DNA-binding protein [Clostridium bovifaecis]